MRVLIEREGTGGGQAVVTHGEMCRVGRSAPAEFACADDTFLSGLHFVVDCTGSDCQVRDLGSRNGTLLNGSRIEAAAVVRDGDRISAGQTHFRIGIEREAPGHAALSALDPDKLKDPQKNLLEILRNQPEPLFALLDAARDDRVLDLLRNSEERYQSLYEGQQGRELDHWAPYLVELPKDSRLLLWLLHEGWGKSWGVYLTCCKPFLEVRKHFRHFLVVESEGRQQLYFRFYDPRVLRGFLANCTGDEFELFFGPINCCFVEGEEPSTLLRHGRNERGTIRNTHVLAGA